MKKIVIVNGLIGGAIVASVMLATMGMFCQSGNFEAGMIVGYSTMIVAFSLVFVGIKNYRDKYNNGVISFGKAFTIGILITLIASTIYVIAWMIDFHFFIPDFGEKYAAAMLAKARAGGASEAEMVKQTADMASFLEMYKNPVVVALFTYLEILPVGLLITIVSSLILKRKAKPAITR